MENNLIEVGVDEEDEGYLFIVYSSRCDLES